MPIFIDNITIFQIRPSVALESLVSSDNNLWLEKIGEYWRQLHPVLHFKMSPSLYSPFVLCMELTCGQFCHVIRHIMLSSAFIYHFPSVLLADVLCQAASPVLSCRFHIPKSVLQLDDGYMVVYNFGNQME